MANSLEFRVPYLSDEVFELASELPLDMLVRVDLGIRKRVLRHVALKLGGAKVVWNTVLRKKIGDPYAANTLFVRLGVAQI